MKSKRLARRIAVCSLCLIALLCEWVAVARNSNAAESEFFPTLWRDWPGEARIDIAFPLSIGAEFIPTPQGQEPMPMPVAAPRPQSEMPLPPETLIAPTPKAPIEGALPGLPPEPEKIIPSIPNSERAPIAPSLRSIAEEPSAMPVDPLPAAAEPAPITPAGLDITVVMTPQKSCVLTVYVPYDAKVTINGLETRACGSRRRFVSCGMKPGLSYKYVVNAQVVRDGWVVEDTRTIVLTAGQNTGVAFGFNSEQQTTVAEVTPPEPPRTSPLDEITPPMPAMTVPAPEPPPVGSPTKPNAAKPLIERGLPGLPVEPDQSPRPTPVPRQLP